MAIKNGLGQKEKEREVTQKEKEIRIDCNRWKEMRIGLALKHSPEDTQLLSVTLNYSQLLSEWIFGVARVDEAKNGM